MLISPVLLVDIVVISSATVDGDCRVARKTWALFCVFSALRVLLPEQMMNMLCCNTLKISSGVYEESLAFVGMILSEMLTFVT